VAHERKEYAKALQLYEESSRLWPQNPYTPYHEARAAMSAGLFDRAFQSYLLSIRVDETATDARVQAARLMQAEGKYGSALELLGSTHAGKSPEAELLTIEIGAHTRGPRAGTNAANRMSQRRPQYFGRAIAAAARGAHRRPDPHDAWSIVEPLLGLEFPPVNQFPILEAAVMVAPGESELAELGPIVERVVAAHPDAPAGREIQGLYLERTGATAEAAARYRAALDAQPDRSSAMMRLARVLAADDPAAALDQMEQALAIETVSNEHFDSELFVSAVDALPASPERRALLESALEIAPASGSIAYRLALALEAEGAEADQVRRLAARAVRFQGGAEAVALRNRVRAEG
jgi:tetratricopeptide (TPR) repeat protein